MKLTKAIAALLALTFGIGGAFAAGAANQAGIENFDSLEAGALDTTPITGDFANSHWVPWTAGDDSLTVTAYDEGSVPSQTTGATGTQANYLKIDTALNNGITFAANGLTETVTGTDDDATYTYEPAPLTITDSDQVYFDSLVNLSAGDPDALAAVGMPGDGRLALWVQAIEVETEVKGENDETTTTTTEINQLCIRAGKISDSDKGGESFSQLNVYTAAVENVEAGWHRLTVRLFKNAARSGTEVPAMAIYLDEVAVAAQADVDDPMSGAVLDRLTPKCLALAEKNALFPSMQQSASTNLGDVKGVQFSGSGNVDDLIFTTERPSFIKANDDVNYFNLTWDEHVTAISYTVNSGAEVTISNISTLAADIPLADGEATAIAVTVTYADGFGAGEWTASDASLDGTTFTVSAGIYTPSGAIVSASTVATAKATVKIVDGDATELKATSLSALITAINEALGEATEDTTGEVYITLSADQTMTLSEEPNEDIGGYALIGKLSLGSVASPNIKWTLDLNGHTITAAGTVSETQPILAEIDGCVTITDMSTDANGAMSLGTFSDNTEADLISNWGTLTIAKGTFNGRVYNGSTLTVEDGTFNDRIEFYEGDAGEDIPAGTGTFNGGKYLISDDTDETYLKFLNDNAGEEVTFAKEDGDDPQYYVVSGATPVETFTVTFVNEKATETTTTETVSSGAYATVPDPAPTADGFIFLGWFAEGSDTAFDFESTAIKANITLTAKWAEVIAKIGDDGYATIQEALDAAVDTATAENEVTVEIVKDYTASDSLTITGSGIDTTKITLNVAEGVTVTLVAARGVYIDGATVTLGGDGTWSKTTDGTLFCVGEKTAAANLVVNGASLVANLQSDNYTGPNKLINVMNGTVTVKSGLLQTPVTYGSCIRLEDSDSDYTGTVADTTTAVIEGGTLSAPTNCDYAPVIVKDENSTGRNKIYILATGSAKFAGPEAKIVGDDTMEDYLAEVDEEETSGYAYTVDYKFVKGTEDDYYTIKEITWATVTVTWDEQVTSWSGTDDDDVFPDADDEFDISTETSYVNQYDVDDSVTCSITAYKFKDGYELDEESSTLTVGPMTDGAVEYTLHIAAKATTPTYEPVDAGSEIDDLASLKAAQALADAINNSKSTMINPPKGVPDTFDRSAYGNLFEATAYTYEDSTVTKYYVQVNLKDDAKATLQTQVNDNTTALEVSKVATAEQTATLKTTPGLYYSVKAGSSLDDRQIRSCELATGGTLDVTLPHYDGAGFYQIEASVQAQTVAGE